MTMAVLLQLILLLGLFLDRTRVVQESTRALPAELLFNVAQLGQEMTSAQREVFAELASVPNLQVTFYDGPPPPAAPISFFDRILGLNTLRVELQLAPDLFLVLNRGAILAEAYAFAGQVGLVVFLFFAIIFLILFRARAALLPVERFADAADRLSKDLHAAPMPERGGEELIQAAQAVNRMQLALQEQVAGRTRLIAGIGHDLRTYITRLTLRAELIPDEAQRRKTLKDLEEMTAVVNQSLELGRADQVTEVLERQDLAAFLDALVEPYVESGQPVQFSKGAEAYAHIRPVALQRAVQNLIGNALRYGEIARLSYERDEGQIRIFIDDQGPGIPENLREEVLKPYVRLESSRNRDTGGTGLGLALTDSLIRQQGGRLSLEDAPGGGLRAILSLPEAAKS